MKTNHKTGSEKTVDFTFDKLDTRPLESFCLGCKTDHHLIIFTPLILVDLQQWF